ncbi:MAG: small basic protein [Candidatus Brocadiia bacterium]
MSMHKSLRSKSKYTRSRNVLTREERIERLLEEEEDRWSEDESVFGLPKVKIETVTPRKKAAEEEEEEELEEGMEGELEGEGEGKEEEETEEVAE